MITEAEIKSINYASNSCTVRIPIFETTNSNEPVILEAKILIQPGIYNGYEIGNSVWVGFADNQYGKPVVIGKIFESAQIEGTNNTSAIQGSNLVIKKSAELPLNTKIGINDADFNNISKIIENIKELQQETGEIYTNGEQAIGQWVDGKVIYRKAIRYVGSLSKNEEVKIGSINNQLSDVLDIKQTVTYGSYHERNKSAYDIWYNVNGSHTIIGCRVDITNGDIYACACNDNYPEGTVLIVIVEYTKE